MKLKKLDIFPIHKLSGFCIDEICLQNISIRNTTQILFKVGHFYYVELQKQLYFSGISFSLYVLGSISWSMNTM